VPVARAGKRTKDWVGPVPYGIGEVKPNHFAEMAKVALENRNHPLYAWRILRDGTCDGCALGTVGMRDFTMEGIHLCSVRLNLLTLNTMDAMDPSLLGDVRRVSALSSKEMRDLGRLGYPMVWRAGEPGYTRISWDEAMTLAASAVRATTPERMAFYLTSRGITNEVYYMAQKVARALGTNNIDNAARLCHSPSTVAMKGALGVAASTVSYKDWIGSDLIVFIGSDVANNQPVTTKYLYYAKKRGTRVAMVNPYREPGMMRYWVPSVAESLMFGTKITDEYYTVQTGGDLAFLNGVLKALLEKDAVDRSYIAEHTTGFDAVETSVRAAAWEDLEAWSGSAPADMERFATMLASARNTIFVWSMGVTQHRHGVDTVRAIMNLALARGLIGREFSGVMPIRGHSGVQGGAEVGCVPNAFPGGRPVNADTAREMTELWGFDVPTSPGLSAAEQIEAAARGDIDMLWSAGGNFLETLPDPEHVRIALASVRRRVHQDIVLTSQMLVEPREWALILPARTRYESQGGGTETTTEREIIFSPEIPGPRPGEARAEWQIFMELATRARPDLARFIHVDHARQIRADIARTTPLYAGIETLARKGDHVQWGGRILCRDGIFPTPDGRARFFAVTPPETALAEGRFMLSTRRGKQFNSMIHRQRDPLNGALRDHVLISQVDADALGLTEGAAIVVRSEAGEMRGRAKISDIKPRNVQVHWPEGQPLLRRGTVDPQCGVPDYNAIVEISRA
jgi:molybdopterin-dependent oxidoreductase alpha subunit